MKITNATEVHCRMFISSSNREDEKYSSSDVFKMNTSDTALLDSETTEFTSDFNNSAATNLSNCMVSEDKYTEMTDVILSGSEHNLTTNFTDYTSPKNEDFEVKYCKSAKKVSFANLNSLPQDESVRFGSVEDIKRIGGVLKKNICPESKLKETDRVHEAFKLVTSATELLSRVSENLCNFSKRRPFWSQKKISVTGELVTAAQQVTALSKRVTEACKKVSYKKNTDKVYLELESASAGLEMARHHLDMVSNIMDTASFTSDSTYRTSSGSSLCSTATSSLRSSAAGSQTSVASLDQSICFCTII